jgi:hypothetical protein
MAKTSAQRQSAYASSGKAIACVIRDHEAIKALGLLCAQHGGITAAVTHALLSIPTVQPSPEPPPGNCQTAFPADLGREPSSKP